MNQSTLKKGSNIKFKIDPVVFEKFPNIIIYIPIITGFLNKLDAQKQKVLDTFIEEQERKVLSQFSSIEQLHEHQYIKSYKECFQLFGANPKKTKPTHMALCERVIEGGHLPNVNPIVNLYNAMSVKYITPYGGEDLSKVYGDFVLTFAKGDEHWLGISAEKPKCPKKGDLVWKDDYDVSTVSLNYRQCERTKMTVNSSDGYFIMDGFIGVNDQNISESANEFVKLFTDLFGGKAEILVIDKNNPVAEIDYKGLSVNGVELPKVEIQQKKESGQQKSDKQLQTFNYTGGTIEQKLQQCVFEGIQKLGLSEVKQNQIAIKSTTDKKFGDFTTTISLETAKLHKQNPFEFAQKLIQSMSTILEAKEVKAIQPGFVNFFLSTGSIKSLVNEIDDSFGNHDIGKGKKIMIEYGQPNTHKELTLGHIKSGISGLSVIRMSETLGYEVIKANYFGDIGKQVSKVIWAVYSDIVGKVKIEEITQQEVDLIMSKLNGIKSELGIKAVAKYYSDQYVIGHQAHEEGGTKKEQITWLNKKIYSKDNELVNSLYSQTRALSIEYQDLVFAEIGVTYDRQYPESEVEKWGAELVKKYTGPGKILEEDDGAIIFKGDKYGLFTWVFMTKDGLPTYSGKDLGLAYKKFEEYSDLDNSYVFTSVEQVDYFKAVIKVLELIDEKKFKGKYHHIGFGWLLFNGKKTSARMGKKIQYYDIIEELKLIAAKKIDSSKGYSQEQIEEIAQQVALSALKFAILSHEFHKDVNYNPEVMMNLNGFSAPYILYAYARANSILATVSEKVGSKLGAEVEVEGALDSDAEQTLLKKLYEFPSVTLAAGTKIAPHLICNYLFELANAFNGFYGEVKIVNNGEVYLPGAKLVEATAKVLKKGLGLIGIDTIEKM